MKNFISLSTFILIVLLGASAGLSAQTAPKMTLETCIVYAMKNNPNLKSIQLSKSQNHHKTKELMAAALPQVSATGQYLYNYALPEQLLPGEILGQPGTSIPVKFGVANTMSVKVELQQVIFNKSLFSGLKIAKTSEALVALNTFKTKEDLVYNIAQLYLQVQITNEQKKILTANIDRINELIRMAELQFQEGLIKKVDVNQLIVNRINLESELRNIEIGIAQQLNVMKFYMGMPQEEALSVENYKEAENSQLSIEKELNIDANMSLRLLDKQIELTSLEFKNTMDGYYPSLAFFANYGWQGQTDRLFSSEEQYKIQGSPTGVLGLSLNVPIFDGLQKSHKMQQIKIKKSQLELDRQYLKNSIELEFANANIQLDQNKVLLKTQGDNIQLAEELYNVAKLSYKEGVAPLSELLNAETSLKEAQTQYLTALLQVNIGELDFIKSSGQLTTLIEKSTY